MTKPANDPRPSGYPWTSSPPVPGSGGPRRWLRLGLRLALIPIALLLVAVGFYAVLAFTAASDVKRDDSLLIGYDGRPTAGVGMNFLVLSSSEVHHTDVVMLVHRNRARDRLYLVSLPRNLEVTVDGKQEQLKNLSNGGQVVRAVESLLGARIEHVASVDIEGFVGLIEALDGVVVKNPYESTTASGLHFPQGQIPLRGEEALAFMNDELPISDRDSVLAERQRSVLRSLVLKVLTPQTITNPVTFNAVLSQLSRYVTVDRGLTSTKMWTLATSTQVSDSSDLVAARAPVAGTRETPEGEVVSLLDEAMAKELTDALRNGRMHEYSKRYPA